MTLFEYLQLGLVFVAVSLPALFLVLFIVQKYIATPLPIIRRHSAEKYFLDPLTIKTVIFPSLDDKPNLELSVIVPAYNEEKRLPIMLDECMKYLEECAQKNDLKYEVIVVSDGSKDQTVKVALKYSKQYTCEKLRVLELIENRGKGGAVRLGMLSARGRKLLFADADGATKFADYEKLDASLESITEDWEKDGIVIGSRAHLEEEAIASRSFFRTFLMHGFHFLVWLFAVRSVRDTQCGFKLMTRTTAHKLFSIMHVERWAFDVELLYLAERLAIPIKEVAVNWKEIEGSKLTPFWSWIQMGSDLFLIWFRYTLGVWRIAESQTS